MTEVLRIYADAAPRLRTELGMVAFLGLTLDEIRKHDQDLDKRQAAALLLDDHHFRTNTDMMRDDAADSFDRTLASVDAADRAPRSPHRHRQRRPPIAPRGPHPRRGTDAQGLARRGWLLSILTCDWKPLESAHSPQSSTTSAANPMAFGDLAGRIGA